MTKRHVLGAANFLMMPLFLMSVVLQYNDPDPIRWMVIYGLALIACVLYAIHRLRSAFASTVGIAAFLWALSILPGLMGNSIAWNQVFGMMHMISQSVEETREMFGLLIVAGWMAVLAFAARKPAPIPQ